MMEFGPAILDMFEKFGIIAVLTYLLWQERQETNFWQQRFTNLSDKLLDSVLKDANKT